MHLDDIIEENTLASISRRTRIPIEYLEAIIEREWYRLQKVQALGFLSILEREYHADLEDIKQECRNYFAQHAPIEEPKTILIVPREPRNWKALYKGAVVVILLLLAYGAWSYMDTPAKKADGNATIKHKGGFFDSVLSTTQGWLGKKGGAKIDSATPIKSSQAPLPKPVREGAWAKKSENETNTTKATEGNASEPLTILKVESAAKKEQETPSSKPSSEGTKDEAKSEAKIIKQVKREQAKAEALRQEDTTLDTQAGEENLSDVSRLIVAATAAKGAEDNGSTKPLSNPEATNENNADNSGNASEQNTPQTAQTQDLTQNGQDQESANAQAQEEVVNNPIVVFHPRSKVWVGYTYLPKMKRTALVATKDISFDTSKGDYILATGHGVINFKADTPLRLNDGVKHYFLISKGKVKEISHEEFQKLNKSKVW